MVDAMRTLCAHMTQQPMLSNARAKLAIRILDQAAVSPAKVRTFWRIISIKQIIRETIFILF